MASFEVELRADSPASAAKFSGLGSSEIVTVQGKPRISVIQRKKTIHLFAVTFHPAIMCCIYGPAAENFFRIGSENVEF